MSLTAIVWIITVVFCGIFLWISLRVQDSAGQSFSNYAIAGGTLPLYLILFTDIATIMGAGNFIGHAAQGYKIGLVDIPFVFGEQGSKIIFALVFAGLAGRFTYNTLSEMMDDLLVRDKTTRAIVGVLTACIMIAWVGGQGKGLGDIFATFTGANPIPIIMLFNAVFIIYTFLGGIYSVVWTDLLQGIIVVVFAFIFYGYAFAPVNFSLGVLQQKLAEVGAANLGTLSNVPFAVILKNFVTGCFGILAAQIYWQRCFAAKDSGTARNGMLVSGIAAVVFVSMTAMVGLVTKVLNPNLENANQAMPWLMMHYTPTWVLAVVFTLILAAAMSSADSNLNSAAVILVNDLIKPFAPNKTDKELVNYAKILTIVVGIFSTLAAIYASSIISLFSKAYTMAGGGIVPVLLVGLLWKKTGEPFTMGVKNSRITPWGARLGIIAGSVISLSKYGILWGVVISAAVTVVVSLLTPDFPEPVSPKNRTA
ncbi:MAG: sodium:solute symporter family protein [Tepidanaerobacteraceae bacterium]|jgi:SSS family transporter|nr:sodium:solute symporter family protein [Tepidanaerobacteraceae bacterium]